MGRHNQKGAEYERKTCGRLSHWVSDSLREDCFWRSAMSGGRANLPSRRKQGQRFDAQSGDISAIRPEGQLLLKLFMVECKWYKNLNMEAPIFGRAGVITAFWKKLRKEAKNRGVRPMLFGKQNRRGEVLCTNAAGVRILQHGSKETLVPIAIFPAMGMHVFLVRDILLNVRFRSIRKWYKRSRRKLKRVHL